MFRASAGLTALTLFASVAGAQSCAVPALVPPSCGAPAAVAPSCAAPGCAAPCTVCEGCVGTTSACQCSGQTGCHGQQTCSSGSKLCKRPLIQIDLSRNVQKTVTKKNGFMSGLAEAPPQGYIAYSVPTLHANIAAVPVSLNTSAAAGSSESELTRLLLETLRDNRAAAATAAAGSNQRCDDPCSDILQLKQDVAQLTQITKNLTLAVEHLVKEKNQ